MVWQDSWTDKWSFFSTPAGRLVLFPLVGISFLVLWAGVFALLWLAIENVRAPLIRFVPISFGLFFWTIIAIWASFYLITKALRKPQPVLGLTEAAFTLNEADELHELPFKSVASVTVTRSEREGVPYHAVFALTNKKDFSVQLFDRSGFVAACRAEPELRYKLSHKLGSKVE